MHLPWPSSEHAWLRTPANLTGTCQSGPKFPNIWNASLKVPLTAKSTSSLEYWVRLVRERGRSEDAIERNFPDLKTKSHGQTQIPLAYRSEFAPDSALIDFQVVNTNHVEGTHRRRLNCFLSAEKSWLLSLPMPTVSLWWVWRIVSFRLLDSPRVALRLRASSTWATHWSFSYHFFFLEIAIFETVLELLQKTTWEHLCIIFTMPWNQFLAPHKLGMVAHACNPRIQEVGGERMRWSLDT